MANWDESKHPRDDDGKFGSGSGVTPASELKKKSAEELAKINPWDDEKTRKMKMKLAKMHAGNQAIKDDIAKRKAHIEQMKKENAKMKKELGINAALMPPMYVANSVQTIEGDAPLAVQLAPFGEFKGVLNKADGKKTPIVQHLDQAAFERILNAWNAAGSPELLVDADHLSCEGGSTKAFAWASNLRIEDGGLYADFRFTDAGRAAVNAREYRFVSPVFNCDENGEAVGLQSVALTNRPNLPGSCVLNRESTGVNNVEDTKDKPKMDKILNALGLGPGASEDDAVAAIAKVKNERDEAKSALVKNAAEKFADDNKDRIENREAVVDLYVKNGKDVAEAFLAAFKAPEKAPEKPAQTVLNAKPGVTPGTVTPLREGLAKCKNAAERCAYVTAHAAEFAAEGK